MSSYCPFCNIESEREIIAESSSAFSTFDKFSVSKGQTISHVHIHLIPRYKGDVKDPEGGVRGVIPVKNNYRSK